MLYSFLFCFVLFWFDLWKRRQSKIDDKQNLNLTQKPFKAYSTFDLNSEHNRHWTKRILKIAIYDIFPSWAWVTMISKSKNKKYNKYQLLFCSTIFLHSRSVIVFDSRYMCLLCNNPNKKIPTQKRTLLPNLYLYLSISLSL